MKLAFESNLQFKHDVIKSIIYLFEGQLLEDSILEYNLKEKGALILINGARNNLILSEKQIRINIQDIQEKMRLKNQTD